MNRLVILDRDGVINQDSDDYVKNLDEWIPIPGSAEAISRLSQAGFIVAVATNQSGLARGYFEQADLDAMHSKMHQLVSTAGGMIHGVFVCPHGPDDGCNCRKPAHGLVDQIESQFGISAKDAYLVGDSLRDLQAGEAKGCKPILVRTGKGLRTLAKGAGLENTLVFDDLSAAADHILG